MYGNIDPTSIGYELDSLLKLKNEFRVDDNKQKEKVKGFIQHTSVEPIPIMLFLWTRASS